MELEYFTSREKELLGQRYEALHTPLEAAPARGLTVNGLRPGARAAVEGCGLALAPSPFCPQGYRLTDPAQRPGLHPYHKAGVYYLQEPSASAPVPLLGVEPGCRVLDLCAAPGGKSSQLASALSGQGLLVSNEYDPARAAVLRGNLERMGVPNALVLNETPDHIAGALPGFFDRVLVDAPCSGEGMFRKEPQAMAQHNPGLVAQCARRGAEILEAAARCLAPGGRLVYSTCTFAPEEDEGQIGRFLSLHPEFTLEDCGASFGSPGEENRLCGYAADTSRMRRIWPGQGGEGHFMACLAKSPDAPAGARPGKGRPKREKPAKTPPLWAEFAARYFPALAGEKALEAGGRVYILPPALPAEALAGGLRVMRAGVLAGSLSKGRFEPDHHLFMVWGAGCENREELTLADERTAAFLRGEEIEARTAGAGYCAVLVDGFPLGFGKVSGGKVKNHLPKALRNLK